MAASLFEYEFAGEWRLPADIRDPSGLAFLHGDGATTGLVLVSDKNNALSGSNFVGFWWNDGISGKGKGSSGSHGVGKTTLTRISGMSLFLAVTKRSDDDRRFLLGFAN